MDCSRYKQQRKKFLGRSEKIQFCWSDRDMDWKNKPTNRKVFKTDWSEAGIQEYKNKLDRNKEVRYVGGNGKQSENRRKQNNYKRERRETKWEMVEPGLLETEEWSRTDAQRSEKRQEESGEAQKGKIRTSFKDKRM